MQPFAVPRDSEGKQRPSSPLAGLLPSPRAFAECTRDVTGHRSPFPSLPYVTRVSAPSFLHRPASPPSPLLPSRRGDLTSAERSSRRLLPPPPLLRDLPDSPSNPFWRSLGSVPLEAFPWRRSLGVLTPPRLSAPLRKIAVKAGILTLFAKRRIRL